MATSFNAEKTKPTDDTKKASHLPEDKQPKEKEAEAPSVVVGDEPLDETVHPDYTGQEKHLDKAKTPEQPDKDPHHKKSDKPQPVANR